MNRAQTSSIVVLMMIATMKMKVVVVLVVLMQIIMMPSLQTKRSFRSLYLMNCVHYCVKS